MKEEVPEIYDDFCERKFVNERANKNLRWNINFLLRAPPFAGHMLDMGMR